MRYATRSLLLALAGVLAALLSGCAAAGTQSSEGAEEYPSEEVRILVPYTAGGPTDLAARTIGAYFEEQFGQPVIVENLPGAAGSMAMNELISSEPDGYTIKLIAAPSTVVTPLIQDVEYGPEDFQTVGVITVIPSVLAVKSDSEFETAEQFFEAAEADPGTLDVGTPGATTSQALELRRLADEYGVEVKIVPFNGNAEMTQALLGDNVDAIFVNASEDIRQQFDAGEFRPLAVSSPDRAEYLPDTPTLAEAGYENLTYSVSIFGFGVPTGTPPEIVSKLEETMRSGLEDPEVREQIGEDYVPDEFIGAEEFRRLLDEIVEVYGPVAEQIKEKG